MSEVRVIGVALDSIGQPVLLLKPIDGEAAQGKILPIWIGPLEATSILAAVQGSPTPRPFAHDLMRSLIEAIDGVILHVEVTRIDEGTFYAAVRIEGSNGEHLVDARPSDAIALAARVGAPIHVADEVLAEAGIEDTLTGGPPPHDDAADEERLAEFRRFLDTVDPDDFKE
ncbi:bifunctional nuclease family protein [Leucobacter soli]|uniref:BFN domain-containing protein n=1 Tax=Leucobacter soli TaxID=2812850 RepID=A0A916JXC2_9MICO|nr:bifunctional nuclease family protein [Leucobacter soli]CAG7604845.1 hypothetical protein LEUCIP111803_00770 [Leucobacter soli]